MAKRVTVLIDDDLYEKLRKIQAKRIQETKSSVSFSKVLSDLLKSKK